jgi:hypothetical protein
MKNVRYWVSWYSGCYRDEGFTFPPFQFWSYGTRIRRKSDRVNQILFALLEAPDKEMIWDVIGKHFPDYSSRFLEAVAEDWSPGSRFPDFDGKPFLVVV